MKLKYFILVAIILAILLFIWKYEIRMEVIGWILLGTMVVIVFYTMATFDMRKVMIQQTKEMIKQTELSIRPQIIAHLDKEGNNFFVNNVGHGTAFNIMVDNLVLGKLGGKEHKLIFDRIDAIMPGKEKKIIHAAYKNDKRLEGLNFLANVDRDYAVKTYEIKITYENIEGEQYSSKVQCGIEGFRLIETKIVKKKRYKAKWIPTEEDKVIVGKYTFVPLKYLDEFRGSNDLYYFIKKVRSVAEHLEEGRAFHIIDTKTGKVVKRFSKEGGVIKEEPV